MEVSVIISTYNSPEWLEKVIWGYQQQSYHDFELLIADDGSSEETRELIQRYSSAGDLNIKHIWHPDQGFQKSTILNKATLEAMGEYLIYSDGDCIPRRDFVEVHVKNAEKGYFLSGGYFMLPMETSKSIGHEEIVNGAAFDINWLYQHGLKKTYKSLKLTSSGKKEQILNALTPTKATWNGHGSSGWKQDILKVNGYNEEMQYGGQDRELGERLMNLGIKGKQIRYSAIVVHLDHKRGYATEQSLQKNRDIRDKTKKLKKIWTEEGIVKGEQKSI